MPFSGLIARGDTGADLPREVAQLVVGDIARSSAAMALGTRVPTTTRDSRIPVLAEAPEAFWVQGDTGLKQTSQATWSPQSLIAEELAVIVPVPDNVVSDSSFDVWSALHPLLVRAAARKIDAAVIFGADAPATWPLSLAAEAAAAGQTVDASPTDPVGDLLAAAEHVGAAGYSPTAAEVRHGWEFAAAAARTDALAANPVGATSPMPLMVAGMPIWTRPAWFAADHQAVVADWDKVLIGIREDLRIEYFNTGVITDEDGAIVMNLMQQDTSAVRMVMRVGYRLAKTVTNLADDTPGVPAATVVNPTGG